MIFNKSDNLQFNYLLKFSLALTFYNFILLIFENIFFTDLHNILFYIKKLVLIRVSI
jgi:hypothetical protein